MILQIALGTGILLINVMIMAMAAFLLEVSFRRAHPWMIAPPQRPKLLLLLIGVCLWVLAVVTSGVWIWALALRGLGAFQSLESAVYFSLVAFTTLGLSDVLAPREWRILSVMAAVNGVLSFGLLTALLVEALRQVRLTQLETRHHE